MTSYCLAGAHFSLILAKRNPPINRALYAKGNLVLFSEHDVVEVVALNINTPKAEISDTGAILMVYETQVNELEYEVECVLPDATNKWIGTFKASQLRLVSKCE